MIILDFIEYEGRLPMSVEIASVHIEAIGIAENIDNMDMPDEQRNEITRTEYGVWGTTRDGSKILIAVRETQEEAEKVYDGVMDAVARGEKVYSTRK